MRRSKFSRDDKGSEKTLMTRDSLTSMIRSAVDMAMNISRSQEEGDSEEDEDRSSTESDVKSDDFLESEIGSEDLGEDDIQQGEEFSITSDRKKSGAELKNIFKKGATAVMAARKMTRERFVIDGEEAQDIWPVTSAWFLGPKAENLDVLKDCVNKAINQQAEFRKYKYFPLDPEYITDDMKKHKEFRSAVRKLKSEAEVLSDRLKNSVPFFSFRSQGHMLWDTTIASNVGYITAMLYNQNNVASMASGVTLQLEREVSRDLCKMVGYRVYDSEDEHTTQRPGSWGHLPNGGTVANLEAMWAARCLKFNALSIQMMMKEKFLSEDLSKVRSSFKYRDLSGLEVVLQNATVWQLLNIPIDEAIDLFDKLHKAIRAEGVEMTFDELFGMVTEFTMEEQGVWDFFSNLQREFDKDCVKQRAIWIVPGSRHYSWDKGNNILGMGRGNLRKISVDNYCRINIKKLKEELEFCLANRVPVMGVTVVFGTTQEGAVDNLRSILELRKSFEKSGLTFYIHVDAAWGGYFASCLSLVNEMPRASINSNGSPHKASLAATSSFAPVFHDSDLSTHFMEQLMEMKEANSITLDPHKSGFCPYPAGGLLYRNGNIRKFLAQKAAYVNHGTKDNEEINLFGVDGSKPGAASAGVWLSHKVIGLHPEGYGLLLRQCTFSAGIMYSMWVSLQRPEDPFDLLTAVPVREKDKVKWSKKRIRREILESDNTALAENEEAMAFIKENGPDTLINCLSGNFKIWDAKNQVWKLNEDLAMQRLFLDNFYKRCSHSFEKPSMVDRGIQIILNSTTWEEGTHGDAYLKMKESLGLQGEKGKLKMIINTCMSPWFRAHKTFNRVASIIRNELYNAYGAIMDSEDHLQFISPCAIETNPHWTRDGFIFGELEASFAEVHRSYHAIALFVVEPAIREKLKEAARAAQKFVKQENEGVKGSQLKYLPLRFKTREKTKLFEMFAGHDDEKSQEESENVPKEKEKFAQNKSSRSKGKEELRDRLASYGDHNIAYTEVAMPEVEVEFSYGQGITISGKIKVKRIIRYQHLWRDFVDEDGYPPTQEYILYSHGKNAYLSHCPNRYPDFQQLIQLDEVPSPYSDHYESELYQEALLRGVVVYLPQIVTGGAPVLHKTKDNVCLDPLKHHTYNAISWSDQGAFTGQMISISIKFSGQGKRWFNGEKINQGYHWSKFPQYFVGENERRRFPTEESEDDVDGVQDIEDAVDRYSLSGHEE